MKNIVLLGATGSIGDSCLNVIRQNKKHFHLFGIGLGGGLGIRNVFRGTELLELNVKSNIGASRDLANANDRFFNLFEFGGDVKLSVPRIVLPFGIGKLIPTKMYPNTQMILGTSLQENIGLDKQFFSTTYQFDWQPNEQKKLNFKLMDLEFVNNTNIDNYFNVYNICSIHFTQII